MTDAPASELTRQEPVDGDAAPHSTRRTMWRWTGLAVGVALAFLAGLYFPRSWLPGDWATHLPSSCSSTLASVRDLDARVANADSTVEDELRSLVDDRPDCFTEQDRKLLDESSSTARGEAVRATVLHVEALASVKYDKSVYEVPAGPVEIRFTGASGILFTFDDPRYRHCLLATDDGGPPACRVNLTPGDYLVYDSVPGHRRAGYEAIIRAT